MGRCGCCNNLNDPKIFVSFVPFIANSYSIPFPDCDFNNNGIIGDGICNQEMICVNNHYYDINLSGCGTTPLPYIQNQVEIENCISENKKNKLKRNYDISKTYISPIIEYIDIFINNKLEMQDEFSYLLPLKTKYNTYNVGKNSFGSDYWRGLPSISYGLQTLGYINPNDDTIVQNPILINGYKGFNYAKLETLSTIYLGSLTHVKNRKPKIKGIMDFYNSVNDVYSSMSIICSNGSLAKGSYLLNNNSEYDIYELIKDINISGYFNYNIIYPLIVGYTGRKFSVTGGLQAKKFVNFNLGSYPYYWEYDYVNTIRDTVGLTVANQFNTKLEINAQDAYDGKCNTVNQYIPYNYTDPAPCNTVSPVEDVVCGRNISTIYKRVNLDLIPSFTFNNAFYKITYKLGPFNTKVINVPIIPLRSYYKSNYIKFTGEGYVSLIYKNQKLANYIYNHNYIISMCNNNIDITEDNGSVIIQYDGYQSQPIEYDINTYAQGVGISAFMFPQVCGEEFSHDNPPPQTLGLYYGIGIINRTEVKVSNLNPNFFSCDQPYDITQYSDDDIGPSDGDIIIKYGMSQIFGEGIDDNAYDYELFIDNISLGYVPPSVLLNVIKDTGYIREVFSWEIN